MSESAPRLHIIRWSLGAAFGLLLVLGAWALAVGHRRQAGTIAAIEALGGSVRTDAARPDWLRDPLLDQLARGSEEIACVKFTKSGATPEEIARLLDLVESLPEARSLRLKFLPLSGSDFERISRLSQIEALDLDGTPVTDPDLQLLARLPRLNWLVLDNTKITDAGLAHLRTAVRLEMISLENTRVSDGGLQHLSALPRLDRVYLTKTAVTVAGLRNLQRARPALRVNP